MESFAPSYANPEALYAELGATWHQVAVSPIPYKSGRPRMQVSYYRKNRCGNPKMVRKVDGIDVECRPLEGMRVVARRPLRRSGWRLRLQRRPSYAEAFG